MSVGGRTVGPMSVPLPQAPDRVDPPAVGADSHDWYEAWLDYHRDTLLLKCAGLTGEQLCRRAVPPSTLSLLGLLRHLTEVERSWFRRRIDRQDVGPLYYSDERPDDDHDATDPARAADDLAAYRAEILAAKQAAARHALDDMTFDPRPDRESFSLRWVYAHMLEEYARHNGHADLLREVVDGATGE